MKNKEDYKGGGKEKGKQHNQRQQRRLIFTDKWRQQEAQEQMQPPMQQPINADDVKAAAAVLIGLVDGYTDDIINDAINVVDGDTDDIINDANNGTSIQHDENDHTKELTNMIEPILETDRNNRLTILNDMITKKKDLYDLWRELHTGNKENISTLKNDIMELMKWQGETRIFANKQLKQFLFLMSNKLRTCTFLFKYKIVVDYLIDYFGMEKEKEDDTFSKLTTKEIYHKFDQELFLKSFKDTTSTYPSPSLSDENIMGYVGFIQESYNKIFVCKLYHYLSQQPAAKAVTGLITFVRRVFNFLTKFLMSSSKLLYDIVIKMAEGATAVLYGDFQYFSEVVGRINDNSIDTFFSIFIKNPYKSFKEEILEKLQTTDLYNAGEELLLSTSENVARSNSDLFLIFLTRQQMTRTHYELIYSHVEIYFTSQKISEDFYLNESLRIFMLRINDMITNIELIEENKDVIENMLRKAKKKNIRGPGPVTVSQENISGTNSESESMITNGPNSAPPALGGKKMRSKSKKTHHKSNRNKKGNKKNNTKKRRQNRKTKKKSRKH